MLKQPPLCPAGFLPIRLPTLPFDEPAYFAYNVGIVGKEFLGEFEQLALLAVLRLGEEAYGVSVRREIEERSGRKVARGAVYVTLERLERKGCLRAHFADPTPLRGGKAKKYFRVTPLGVTCLRHSARALSKMWEGLEPTLGEL